MITLYGEIMRIPITQHQTNILVVFEPVDSSGLTKSEVITAINARYPHLHRRYISNKNWGMLQFFINRGWIIKKRRFSEQSRYFSGLSTLPF